MVATLKMGDYFGEQSLLLREPRSASVRALSYGILYSINRHTFDPMLEKFPVFGRQIRETIEEHRKQNDLKDPST